jgi:hypothetical protein
VRVHHDIHPVFYKILLFQVVVGPPTSWWAVEGGIRPAIVVPVFGAGGQGYLRWLGELVVHSCRNEGVVGLGAGFLLQVDVF